MSTYTSFNGHKRIASGPLKTVALEVKRAIESDANSSVRTFDDATGRSIDIDTEGSDAEVLARLPSSDTEQSETVEAIEGKNRGRPKLGVVAREVTLLPRHWEWLATQPGGASVA